MSDGQRRVLFVEPCGEVGRDQKEACRGSASVILNDPRAHGDLRVECHWCGHWVDRPWASSAWSPMAREILLVVRRMEDIGKA